MTQEAGPPAEEPTLKPAATALERHIERGLQQAASLLSSLVALLLLALVGAALLALIVTVVRAVSRGDFNHAVIDGLDSAFLVIILLELVHTTLARGPISSQVQEFLVVGITSAVRSGLEIAAERGDSKILVANLAINVGGVLLLVAALWLVRQRLHSERSDQRRTFDG